MIRVATYNLYLGADLSVLLGDATGEQLDAYRADVRRQLETTAFPRRAPAIARILARERVDLVGLQEVCTWHADGQLLWDCTAELLAALEAVGEPYDVVVTQRTFHGTGEMDNGGATVSFELEGRNAILRRRGSPVRVESTDARMYGTALAVRLMGSLEITIDRGWCSAACTVDGVPGGFTFVDTHTEAYDAGFRDRQRTELVRGLPRDEPLVVVGDFNATPDRVGMPADMVDAWRAAGNPDGGPEAATCCQVGDLTNPESVLADRIDYIWVRGVTVEECVRIGADPADRTEDGLWPSDHAGVVATLALPDVVEEQVLPS
jgi:endonuclease/exonuclease/phosphatase family metal-dependent hydrolase